MKLRFSLRSLLLLVAALAALGYWRHRPRQTAQSFVDALEAGDYSYANSLLMDDEGQLAANHDVEAEFWARRCPQTCNEWFAGTCRVQFIGKGTAFGRDGTAIVTARGIQAINLNVNARALLPTKRAP